MRLDKLLSENGMTRSEAKKAVAQGRVTVNGETVRDAGKNVSDTDSVLFAGREISRMGEITLMMHKPQGVITATEDPRQETVLSLVPAKYRAKDLAPVGRLDKDTTGLLFLTTNGQMGHFLISPKRNVEKVYRATVEGKLDEEDIRRMAEGIPLKDFTAKGAKMTILSARDDASVALLTVTEGKYHQVKRMFGAIGHPVTALHRQQVGPLTLDENLKEGEVRLLTDEEVAQLRLCCGMEEEDHG